MEQIFRERLSALAKQKEPIDDFVFADLIACFLLATGTDAAKLQRMTAFHIGARSAQQKEAAA